MLLRLGGRANAAVVEARARHPPPGAVRSYRLRASSWIRRPISVRGRAVAYAPSSKAFSASSSWPAGGRRSPARRERYVGGPTVVGRPASC
jgi:hypothetical protein